VPEFITANGKPLGRRKDLDQPGFTFDDSNRVLRIRHDDARNIDVQGKGGNTPPYYVSFDDPHLPADTVLKGQYPTGVIDWGAGAWRINVPEGAFGTFNLAIVDSKASSAQFRFCWPRVFVGLDAYNGGTSDATVTIRSAELRAVSVTVKPGQLQRLRTGWRDVSSSVMLGLKNGEGLRFDNLAYVQE
jgi:hypothetical protein